MIETEEHRFHYHLQEHMGMAFKIKEEDRFICPMEDPQINEKEMREQIKKMKNKKNTWT